MVLTSRIVWVLAAGLILLFCSGELSSPLTSLYTPTIVFSGWINADSIVLPGNFYHPNTCSVGTGSIDMCFYSAQYRQKGMMVSGDQMKLSLFICASDTILSNGAVLLRYSRFENGNETYQISRGDSIVQPTHPIRMYLRSCGGEIYIEELSARPRLLGGAGSGAGLVINGGTIRGQIR